MRISFDLDSVIFDIEPLYRRAFAECNMEYRTPTDWNVYKCYPFAVASRLHELFVDDALYNLPVISAEYPVILNNILKDKRYETFFVTQRLTQQHEKSYQQLRRAGIECTRAQVYDESQPKAQVLKDLNIDLHFDDSPNVVGDCIRNDINVVMISNPGTLYNHHMRTQVRYFNDLKTALYETGIYTR